MDNPTLQLNYDEIVFLRESNNIEDIWDDDSLQQAIIAWCYLKEQVELTPHVMFQTHKRLMLHQKLLPNERGYFRQRPVWIGGREGKPHYAIPELIENWCKDVARSIVTAMINNSMVEKPLDYQEKVETAIMDAHIRYENIHPFIDGNGRTGRMFMNWQRLQLRLPILIIEENHKQDYYDWFK